MAAEAGRLKATQRSTRHLKTCPDSEQKTHSSGRAGRLVRGRRGIGVAVVTDSPQGPPPRDVKQLEDIHVLEPDSRCCCGTKKASIAVCLMSLALVLTGVFGIVGFDSLFHIILNKEVALSPSSQAYPMWKDVGHKTLVKFYFFNVTNPEEVLAGGKPVVNELGPYTYRALWIKHNITFNDNGTLSYQETKQYFFDRDESVGPETDEIVTVNVPFVTTAKLLKEQNFIIRGIASLSLAGLGQRIFITRTVGQLTFGGYPDILILLGSVLDAGKPKPGQPGFNIRDVFGQGYRAVIDGLGYLLDPDHPGAPAGKFGYMVNKNDTVDGEYTIYTGENDISKVNEVYQFNGQRSLHVWPGEECNQLHGTLGHIRPPLSKSDDQVVFIPDICRSLPTHSVGTEQFKGMEVKRFVAGPWSLDSGRKYRENSCFTLDRDLPEGGADLAPCKQGAPLVLSFPHFLYADPSYLEGVSGLRPNASLHQFYFNSEPTLGVTVNARGRIQINVILERVFGLGPFSRVGEGVLPLFWQETYVEAQGKTVRFLNFIIRLPEYIHWMAVAVVVAGSIILAVSAFCLFRPRDQFDLGSSVKVHPAEDGKATANMSATIPGKVEKLILDRIPNRLSTTQNNFINELKSHRKHSEPSAPVQETIIDQ
ncbi:scavenger receptor class B member 1-like [Ornithodoros turicata]|uniref:scavenger receptor class B member 1-like n=1 Tax=Ornithodoros turicata TaxID=34597 RepID=UPI003139E7DC